MELRQLATFREVVRQGSFGGAARATGVAQSTVTLHIQQLEADLGVELFDRSARRVRLTAAGQALCEQVAPLLGRVEALREAVADVAEGEAGHVRLGCIEPTASRRLPPVLARFCRERPNVRLSVELGGTEAIARRVARGELDAGICSRPDAEDRVAFEPLFRERMGLLVPAGHPLASAESVRLTDLAGHRLLVTEQACAYRRLAEGALRARDIAPSLGVEIGSVQALNWAVRGGLGVAIVPTVSATPALDGVVLREIADLDLSLTVGLVRPVDAPPPGRTLAALLDACRRQFVRDG
jgi:DNA-binding transcriptional LysR family regulator